MPPEGGPSLGRVALVPWLVVLAGAAASCGGTTQSAGTASVNGTVDGAPFSVAAGGAFEIGAGFWSIRLTNRGANTCGGVVSNYANGEALTLAVGSTTGTVSGPGTYESGPGSQQGALEAGGYLTKMAADCTETRVDPTSAKIILSELSATRLAGTYTIDFDTEGSFSGGFDVPICPKVASSACEH